MIDSATGDISIRNADVVIGSSLKRATFLASSFGRCAEISVENGAYCSYNTKIPASDLMELPAILTLYFHDEQLESVSISALAERFGGSWDDWSEEKELERKQFHDQWLTTSIGSSTCDQSWGQLSSHFDAKGGFSTITVRYA